MRAVLAFDTAWFQSVKTCGSLTPRPPAFLQSPRDLPAGCSLRATVSPSGRFRLESLGVRAYDPSLSHGGRRRPARQSHQLRVSGHLTRCLPSQLLTAAGLVVARWRPVIGTDPET